MNNYSIYYYILILYLFLIFSPPSAMKLNTHRHPIYKLLTNVTELGINNFSSIALPEGKDVMVLFFTPKSEKR